MPDKPCAPRFLNVWGYCPSASLRRELLWQVSCLSLYAPCHTARCQDDSGWPRKASGVVCLELTRRTRTALGSHRPEGQTGRTRTGARGQSDLPGPHTRNPRGTRSQGAATRPPPAEPHGGAGSGRRCPEIAPTEHLWGQVGIKSHLRFNFFFFIFPLDCCLNKNSFRVIACSPPHLEGCVGWCGGRGAAP